VKPSADPKVFEWFGRNSNGSPYYLTLLNLNWSPEGVDYDLAKLRQVAMRLQQDLPYWKAVILDVNWRFTLVGCAAAILLGEKRFYKEFTQVFLDTMVSPQVALALGLLHANDAQAYFENILLTANKDSNPRAVISAQQVLIRLVSKTALAFDDTAFLAMFNISMRDYGRLAYSVVDKQWTFWKSRIRSGFSSIIN
jgi:hypothetical protein